MTRLTAAAVEILSFLRDKKWQACIIGGLAVQRWGQPRQTRDVDVTLLSGLGGEAVFIDALLMRFQARVPNARRLALDRRVLLLTANNGIAVDVALGGLDFEGRMMERSSTFHESGTDLVTCSAEDLVILKAFAGRALDWFDVEGVLARQGARLDRALILEELRPLLALKEDDEAEGQLQRLFAKHRV